MNFTLAGAADATALAALSSEIQTWSDGYNVTLLWTLDSTYFASMASDTTLEVAFGNAATLATAPNGAYNYFMTWTWSSPNVSTTTALKSHYLPTAVVTTAGDLGSDSTSAVEVWYDTNASAAIPKYGWTQAPTTVTDSSTNDFVDSDNTLSGMFYMPKEPTTAATGETDATGDRLDTGDVLGVFCGAGTPDATGAASLTLTLGAASLAVAGSAALATALTF